LRLWAAFVVGLALTYACGPSEHPSTPAGGGASGTTRLGLGPVDVLVFAPHPDDEVIGAGGVIQQALEAGQHVRIVFATNGDGYPQAASGLLHKAIPLLRNADYLHLAAARQHEAMAADHVLGVSASDLVFLGYPDGVLAGVNADTDSEPVRSPTTGRTTTYGPVAIDYHTLAYGRPAAYTHAAILADVEELLRKSRPTAVYVTDSADQHPDHKATYDLVRDAIAAIRFRGILVTFVVHGGQGWPWPQGPTPDSPFESRTIDGTTYPVGVAWPPSIRVPLTAAQSALKLQALEANHSQMEFPIDRLVLESFVKSEEVFWTGR
jgi:LmbE family N-acetylglucosaminyl deacetylase